MLLLCVIAFQLVVLVLCWHSMRKASAAMRQAAEAVRQLQVSRLFNPKGK